MNRARSIKRAFWTLCVGVFVIAVVSTGLAVREAVSPFVKETQRKHVGHLAEDAARRLEEQLISLGQSLALAAKRRETVALAMALEPDIAAFERLFAAARLPASTEQVHIFNISGQPIVEWSPEANRSVLFSAAERSEAIDQFLRGQESRPRPVVRYKIQGAINRFLIGVPIFNHGVIEGALTGEFQADLVSIAPAEPVELGLAREVELAATREGVNALHAQGFYTEPLIGPDLTLGLLPDPKIAAALERELLWSVALAVGIVLMIPFGLFAFFGRQALVEPHLRLQQSQNRLKKQSKELAKLAAIAEKAADAILVTDLQNRIVWTNPAFTKLSGYDSEEVAGRKPGAFLHGPLTDPEATAAARRAMQQHIPAETDILCYAKNGDTRWFNIAVSPLRGDDGETYGFLSIARDVTEQRRQREWLFEAKREIEYQATHDALTELPNRRALDAALAERLLPGADGGDQEVALIRIDLDHFKYVNDTMGHAAGDFALANVARIIPTALGPADLPARIGGDEFVILLAPGSDRARAERIAETLRAQICRPMPYNGRTIHIGASFGLANSQDGLLPAAEIIVGADAALYQAKREGRGGVRYYGPELHQSAAQMRDMAEEIQGAIRREEFEPFFQPQIDAKTRRIVGVETLVRWPSRKYGLLCADSFLPIADRLSLVADIDAIVLRKALDAIASLEQSGLYVPKLSLNVTETRLQDPALLTTLLAEKPPGLQVAFELVESILLDEMSDKLQFHLDRLREAGVSIEIDDFGSGHASVIGLMQARPDVMKIDKRLVLPLPHSTTARRLASAIVEIGKSLGIGVTAEGVETEQHAQILTELGCDTLQGFLFARAMPVDELATFLRSDRGDAPRAETFAFAQAGV